ncbi:MAG: NfeD family protein [Bacilli bacterium]|nr:NfeD family protein [Bacilli bacterium]
MTMFWGVLFLIFLFIELVTINLVTIWFAIGSLITLFVTIFIECNVFVQTIIFIVTSLISLIVTKPLLRKFKVVNFEPTNSDRYIGKKGDVIKRITPKEKGEVKVLGTVWTAISDETLEVGDEIEVIKIDGVKLIVKKEEK